MEESTDAEVKCKVIILGDSMSGKTSILYYLRKQEFICHQAATMGVEQFCHLFHVQDTTVNANIWDTCGQERFFSLGRMYYKDAIGALLVFDITDQRSFQRADSFLTAFKAQANTESKTVLVGNKADMASSRVISILEAETYAQSHNLQYFETSAKTGANIEAAFMTIALFAAQQKELEKVSIQSFHMDRTASVRLSTKAHKEKRSKKCRC